MFGCQIAGQDRIGLDETGHFHENSVPLSCFSYKLSFFRVDDSLLARSCRSCRSHRWLVLGFAIDRVTAAQLHSYLQVLYLRSGHRT